MFEFLRHRRTRREIATILRTLASVENGRAPLETARLCRRLAELYAVADHRTEAVRWFGHCIDSYVHAGYAAAAAAICNRLIEFEPRVVRARATLAMLLLTQDRCAEAAEAIEEYVELTRERGERIEVTRRRLHVMSELTEDTAVRSGIARALLDLGATEMGNELLSDLRQAAADGQKPRPTPQERWRRLLEVAVDPRGDREADASARIGGSPSSPAQEPDDLPVLSRAGAGR